MLRLKGERVYQGSQVDVIAPNMFAGSILDLEPDTAYEAQFVMSDPDGIRGEGRRMVTVRTRPEPQPYEGGRVFHVYPHGFSGQKIEPSFEGLMCAYNYSCAGTDWATAGRPRVRAGDTILVHAGVYKYNRYEYTNDASVNRTVAARRHVLPDSRRHARNADRDQGCRRRRRSSLTAPATSRCSMCAPPTTPTSKA